MGSAYCAEEQEETYDFDSEIEESMEESDNEPLEETNEENKLTPRLPIRRNQ